jgi:starch-binding outer membrane protein, SusD/RagB family
MKNNILKKSLACFTALMLAAGCSNDFLNSEIPGRLEDTAFYRTDEDATQATTAIYSIMQAHYFTSGWTNSIYFVKLMPSDESNAAGSGPSDQPAFQALDDYAYNSQNDAITGAWRVCYYAINRANKVINGVEPENDLRSRLIAEAKALRAYNYLELVSLWGDVPLVLTDLPMSEWTATGRSPKGAIYAQIEKDLNEAIPVLPIKSQYSGAERFRISKGAAQAMLGKALLYQEKWAEAATQFDAVIASGQYGLEPDLGRLFSLQGEYGTESLFEIGYTNQVGFDWGNFPWDNGSGGRRLQSNIHIQLMGPRSDFYSKAPGDSLIGGWGFNTPTAKMNQAFVDAGDTKRRMHTLMSEAELKAKGGNWTAPNAYDYEGFIRRKYGTFDTQTNSADGAVPELNYGTNWRLIRYADVLLMAAEAHHRAGNDGTAQRELNKVRQRAELPAVTATGPDLFEAIVTERQLELAYEGFRFVDLVRWGRAATELGSRGFQQGKHELMPIPDNDVKTAGLSQNQGY